jgi:hypothetical protein
MRTHLAIVFALLVAAVGVLAAVRWIFVVAAIFAGGMGFAAFAIRAGDVDYEAARAGQQGEEGQPEKRTGWRELFHDRRILEFAAVVVLFSGGGVV